MRTRRGGGVIALDGPAGVGKSTVGTMVARKLGYRFINTGEMYRALAWKALDEGVDVGDGRALARLARRLDWDFRTNSDGVVIHTVIDGRDLSGKLQAERVGMGASLVSRVPAVRRHLQGLQRRLGRGGGIVMEGRDITTKVFPDADLKIFLDASARARAERRTKQLRSQGKRADTEVIRKAIVQRDRQDSRRRTDPLRKARGAVRIDSTRLTRSQVVGRILKLFEHRRR